MRFAAPLTAAGLGFYVAGIGIADEDIGRPPKPFAASFRAQRVWRVDW